MKKLLILPLLLFIIIESFGQASDSLTNVNKNYMNNIQTNLLGVIGYPSLQYERALNKDFSLSFITNYKNPLFTSSFKKLSLHVEGRFYTDKNLIANNGFYLAGDIGFNYERYYHSATQSHVKYNEDIKYLWSGFGLGYQLLAKKRFVIDANIIAFVGFKGKYKLSNDATGWRGLSQFSQGDILCSVNIGYAF